MNQSADAQPDLSALSREVRVRIAVAETQGATWACLSSTWCLLNTAEAARAAKGPFPTGVRIRPNPAHVLYVYLHPEEPTVYPELPDYPVAWGALVEQELDGLDCCITTDKGAPRNRLWRARWTEGSPFPNPDAQRRGPWVWPIGAAVCAAVLAKYGIDWHTLEPVA